MTGRVALVVGAVALVAAGFVVALRAVQRRSRSVRTQLLVALVGAVGVGAATAAGLAWLMVVDRDDLATVAGVLAVTAVVAVVLVVLATGPLGADLARVEATVRRIEGGDLDARTGVGRADELGHVARALDELSDRLGRLEAERAGYEAERSAMLTSVSHDLRTPLAALRAAVEALTDGVAPDPERYLRAMRRDVEALSALVDDLFLLVRLEHGRYEVPSAVVDLSEIADEAIEALAPVAERAGVALVLTSPGRVRVTGNAAALGRVIRNLLDNAVRHAPEGSLVEVEVLAGDRPRVRVADAGPGFDAPFVATAFERFTRADASRGRDTGGAGLGLAIARGLVEAHGGRIWIEAPPGGRIAFELPAA